MIVKALRWPISASMAFGSEFLESGCGAKQLQVNGHDAGMQVAIPTRDSASVYEFWVQNLEHGRAKCELFQLRGPESQLVVG